MLTRYADQAPFRTKDGSEIRELMHPAVHGNHKQSLAEARIDPGAATRPHRHLRSEEIYHITAGTGLMHLAGEQFPVGPTDSIAISPGSVHWIQNTGQTPLVILCCCSPPYSHEDTELA